MKEYRKIWEQNYGKIPVDEFGRSYEIHHIDGNNTNNDLNNLKCVTIQEHYDIHLEQGDYGACALIAKRMKLTPEELSKIASELSKKNWQKEEYRVFQSNLLKTRWRENKEYAEKIVGILLESTKERIKNGTHAFVNPENRKNNRKVLDAKMKELVAQGKHNFQSKEFALLSSNRAKERNVVKYTCPHCQKDGVGPVMKRHHFDNCKLLAMDFANGH